MKSFLAEFIGTMTLVLFGCGSAVVAGPAIQNVGIAFAFGISIVAMAYGIGAISGAHLNPAVTAGVVTSGRMTLADGLKYMVAQILGAIAAAFILKFMAANPGTLGSNVIQPGYSVGQGVLFEIVFTFIFLVTILGVTAKGAPSHLAGLAIGLTLVAIHLVGIPITGTSVNPARSIGPALVSMDPEALKSLWIFIVSPLVGAIFAGLLFRARLLEPEPIVVVEQVVVEETV